jgi:hypothetical protein
LEQLRDRISTTGLAYDKWCDWHVDEPKNYSAEQIAAYCFVVDAMNFCFWPDNPSGVFEYDSMTRNLEKILKNDPEFFTCQRLMAVDENFLREHVFTTPKPFCLVSERARIIREIACAVKSRFGSSFENFIQQSGYDCPTLVDMIVREFSGFRDEAIHRGEQIFFYKRAQILVADLIGAFGDIEHPCKFLRKEELTMFADYRVP